MRSFIAALGFGFGVAASAHAGIQLVAIEFPVAVDGKAGPAAPPLDGAPLSQAIVFRFDGKPKIGPAVADALSIRVAAASALGPPIGAPAPGTYEVAGKRVIFRPRLPTAPLPATFGPASDPGADAALPGLLPATAYEIVAKQNVLGGVKNLTKIASGAALPVLFSTVATAAPQDALAAYFSNVPGAAATLVPKSVLPKDGTKGLHPNLFLDPAGIFSGVAAKKRPPFSMRFAGPISPDLSNLAGSIRLRATKDATGVAIDRTIGVTPILVANAHDESEVLVYPRGILPLGHTIVLELSSALAALSDVAASPSSAFAVVAEYRVANDPMPGAVIEDALVEDFSTTLHEDKSLAASGLQPAIWNASGNTHLRATFGFGGNGALGRLLGPNTGSPVTIHLDTDYQPLPLFSGATPDAKPGTVVTDGVFRFTDIYLPPNVTLVARGMNPLVLLATGNVRIEGTIDLNGSNGGSDSTFDKAFGPVGGGSPGPGGGRGGDAHALATPFDEFSIQWLVTPLFGGNGKGPLGKGLGGGGGQNGCTLPWTPFATGNCQDWASLGDGSRGAGGGGGSLNVFLPMAPDDPFAPISGRRGAVGIGNHLPIPYDPMQPFPAPPAAYEGLPGNPTNAVATPNPNPTFAEAHASGLIFDDATPLDVSTTWAQTRRVTMFGGPGVPLFVDSDPTNDFIGPNGEWKTLVGGQGGGAGASRTEGLSLECHDWLALNGLPLTVLDARGGGGGGGGGGLLVQARGTIELHGGSARILARGGNGGGGEGTGQSSMGGAGGSGSGGVVILQSATNVLMSGALPSVVIDVSGGCPATAIPLSTDPNAGTTGGDDATIQVGDGGPGGPGLVQIEIPEGAPIEYDAERIVALVFPTAFQVSTTLFSCATPQSGSVPIHPLVPQTLPATGAPSLSLGRSTWYDLGAVTSEFRPPIATSAGALAGPLFGVPGAGPFFRGTDDETGLVETDALGNVLDPFLVDIDVDAPDLLKADFIPNGPAYFQTVRVAFEGADDDPLHPGSPDLSTATGWVADPTSLNGKRFVRFEIQFDIAANPAAVVTPATPLPQVNRLRLPFRF